MRQIAIGGLLLFFLVVLLIPMSAAMAQMTPWGLLLLYCQSGRLATVTVTVS